MDQPIPGQPTELPAEPQEDGGFTICISSSPDGSLSVSTQPGATPGKPAADRKEALTMALELLKNGGQDSAAEAEEQFSGGFASRSGDTAGGYGG